MSNNNECKKLVPIDSTRFFFLEIGRGILGRMMSEEREKRDGEMKKKKRF